MQANHFLGAIEYALTKHKSTMHVAHMFHESSKQKWFKIICVATSNMMQIGLSV